MRRAFDEVCVSGAVLSALSGAGVGAGRDVDGLLFGREEVVRSSVRREDGREVETQTLRKRVLLLHFWQCERRGGVFYDRYGRVDSAVVQQASQDFPCGEQCLGMFVSRRDVGDPTPSMRDVTVARRLGASPAAVGIGGEQAAAASPTGETGVAGAKCDREVLLLVLSGAPQPPQAENFCAAYQCLVVCAAAAAESSVGDSSGSGSTVSGPLMMRSCDILVRNWKQESEEEYARFPATASAIMPPAPGIGSGTKHGGRGGGGGADDSDDSDANALFPSRDVVFAEACMDTLLNEMQGLTAEIKQLEREQAELQRQLRAEREAPS